MQPHLWEAALLAGTVAFALSGAMTAMERALDLLGVLVLGTVTAVGGGIVRDCLLGLTPPGALSRPREALLALAVSLFAFLAAWLAARTGRHAGRWWSAALSLMDAVGLGVFSVSGVQSALSCGHGGNAFLCLFMGVLTGVGGGLMRDVLAMQVPSILHRRIYALASLLGAGGYYLLVQNGVSAAWAMPGAAGAVVLIRLLATRYRWHLPLSPPLFSSPRRPPES